MIKVAIVDDEQTICDKIKNILLKFDDIRTYTYNSLSLLDQKYDFNASIYLGPVKQRNVNKITTVLINTDNRCNLY